MELRYFDAVLHQGTSLEAAWSHAKMFGAATAHVKPAQKKDMVTNLLEKFGIAKEQTDQQGMVIGVPVQLLEQFEIDDVEPTDPANHYLFGIVFADTYGPPFNLTPLAADYQRSDDPDYACVPSHVTEPS